MMMTDAAIVSLDDSWRSMRRRISSLFRTIDAQPNPESPASMARFVDDARASSAHHEQDRKSARVAAVRGLLYAREGQFDRAEQFFTEALTLDPSLSPTVVPTFWNLSDQGQASAVRALQNSGRRQDAQQLADAIGSRRQVRAAS